MCSSRVDWSGAGSDILAENGVDEGTGGHLGEIRRKHAQAQRVFDGLLEHTDLVLVVVQFEEVLKAVINLVFIGALVKRQKVRANVRSVDLQLVRAVLAADSLISEFLRKPDFDDVPRQSQVVRDVAQTVEDLLDVLRLLLFEYVLHERRRVAATRDEVGEVLYFALNLQRLPEVF